MKITNINTDEIDISELAAFMFQVMRDELDYCNISFANLEVKLRDE